MSLSAETTNTQSSTSIEAQNDKINNYLACVIDMIVTHGWVSKTLAYKKNMQSTADIAWQNFIANDNLKKKNLYKEPSASAITLAIEAVAWLKSISDNNVINENKLHKAYNIIVNGYYFLDEIKVMATLAAAYLRYLKYQNTEYVGEVGQRQIFYLYVDKVSIVENASGAKTYFHVLKNNEGNFFVYLKNHIKFFEGEQITIEATIKKHQNYHFCKQTVLTACREIDETYDD